MCAFVKYLHPGNGIGEGGEVGRDKGDFSLNFRALLFLRRGQWGKFKKHSLLL